MHDPEDVIALFPLANVVLFPATRVPLYIFEPRYREMIDDALAAERLIGMIAVPPDHAGAMRGDPPLFGVGCEGRIAEAQQRPDSTWDIVLEATRRFRVIEERPESGKLYRRALVEELPDRYPAEDRAAVEARRDDLFIALRELVALRAPDEVRRLEPESFAQVDDARLANLLGQTLRFDVVERQQLLEAVDVKQRFELLRELVRFQLAMRDAQAPGSQGPVH
ncbi:MAG: LON peptidase substrate-binding domain-containing protein [Deltaproteobacteria bacterium]|nr:LON peptidase substrate-binding domain-containing protein [Deltaproteobacteria bacterium]MBW2417802.1 LON peptidase substrate-binding domain-containing protein [Deltaproteobacteria bacterium]